MMTKLQERERQLLLKTAHTDYQKGLHQYSFFKVRNFELSHDLVQETFIKTWHYIVKGGKIEIMKAFLYHVMNNLIVDEYRKRKTVSLDILLENGFEPQSKDFGRLFNTIDGKSAFGMIKKLPEKYQKVMKMRYSQDLSLKEIALLTGQTRNATAVQVHRGLKKLKEIYNRVPVKVN